MVPRLVLAKDTVQQVSEAIAAILDLDVEIADQRLSRVAGTGAFAQKIGEPLDRDGFVNREVMRTGDYVLIDETGKHVVCQACARAGSCYATALLCYPIKAPGTTIGTISLVACDSRRRAWLLGNLASCIAFLSKMSELITAKVLEQQALLAQESLHRQLALVMDFLGEGIIAVDRYGVITHFNSYAAQLFGVMPGLVVGQEIRDMVGGTGVYDVLCGGEQQRQQRILMKVGATTCPVLCDAIPIAVDGKSMGAVLKFRDIQTSSRMAYEMSYAAKAVTFEDILGVSRQIKQVKLEAQQVARSSSTVLIYGGAAPVRSSWPGPSIPRAPGAMARLFPSTWVRFPTASWRASFSATKQERSPVPKKAASWASSSWPTEAHYSSTRSVTCRCTFRSNCSGCWKSGASNPWAARGRDHWTSVSSVLPTATWGPW